MRYEKPYRAIVVLENNPDEYAVVSRKEIPEKSFPGGGELKIDNNSPIETGLRELCEETGITREKIEVFKTEVRHERKRDVYVIQARMKKVDLLPGWISNDKDISHYEWIHIERLRQMSLTQPDTEIMIDLYNNSRKINVAA